MNYNFFEHYSLLVTIIATLFAVFSGFITYVGYWKFTHAEKIVDRRLKEKMDEFENTLTNTLLLIQEANTKIQASYKCSEEKNYDGAISLLVDAEKIYPKAYNLYNSLGYAYRDKGDNYVAAEAFKRAIKLHPTRIAGYNDIINLYYTIGDEKSVQVYTKLAEKNVIDAKEKLQITNLDG